MDSGGRVAGQGIWWMSAGGCGMIVWWVSLLSMSIKNFNSLTGLCAWCPRQFETIAVVKGSKLCHSVGVLIVGCTSRAIGVCHEDDCEGTARETRDQDYKMQRQARTSVLHEWFAWDHCTGTLQILRIMELYSLFITGVLQPIGEAQTSFFAGGPRGMTIRTLASVSLAIRACRWTHDPHDATWGWRLLLVRADHASQWDDC